MRRGNKETSAIARAIAAESENQAAVQHTEISRNPSSTTAQQSN
jgi:hypothetical protein